MFKDEEGFLAEYVAYYKVHGFDHIILWDHNSTDYFREELLPWTSTGYVEIRNVANVLSHPNVAKAKRLDNYWRVMAIKRQIEREAFLWGIKNGYDYYLTADVDEYVLPMFDQIVGRNMPDATIRGDPGFIAHENVPLPFITIADAVDSIFNDKLPAGHHEEQKPKLYLPLLKYNYIAAPHILEPEDLLTIEAYLTRYSVAKHMNFYGTVMPKYIYRLSGEDLSRGSSSKMEFAPGLEFNAYNSVNFTDYQVWLSNCCFFHGCKFDKGKNIDVCNFVLNHNIPLEFNLYGRNARANSPYWLRMNHYARSFEKFGLKALTWETANQASNQYELKEFLSRSFGSRYDPSALVYSCVVRAEINRAHAALKLSDGTDGTDGITIRPSFEFLRRGRYWSRNLEFSNSSTVNIPYNPILTTRLFEGSTRGVGDGSVSVGFIDYYG